jgi:hypothetical protein
MTNMVPDTRTTTEDILKNVRSITTASDGIVADKYAVDWNRVIMMVNTLVI